jgi:type IX secretion system PorP/SprF family membrane protein
MKIYCILVPSFKAGLMLYRFLTVLTVVTVILFNQQGKAQDAEFSQFYANPLYLNPALTGAAICPRAILNYRNQWPGLAKSFVTYSASFDQYINKLHGGIGVMVNMDNAGDGILKTTQASLIYAYSLQASENFYINMALQATFLQKSLNWDLLQFGDEIDPQQGFVLPTAETPPDNSSVAAPDFSAGVAFGWKGILHGGVAVNHLTEPNLAFYNANTYKLPMKITGHVGVNINLEGGGMGFAEDSEPKFYLAPNLLYQQQGDFHQLNAGIYIIRLPIVIGTWFRHNFENADAIIVLAGFDYKNLKIGYSYDITLSKLKSNTGGSHEISVAWKFNCIEKRRKLRAINAPGF